MKLTILPLFIILLILSCSAFGQDTVVESGDKWKYFDQGNILSDKWTVPFIDISDWPEGNTPLGFGQDDEATVINKTNKGDSLNTFFLFQKTINLKNVNDYKTFLLRIIRDDGVIVYINGKEIARSNLYEGNISSKTLASTLINGRFEYKFYEYFVSPSYFNTGENIITVILYQYSKTSSDCRFDMELIAYDTYKILNQLIYNLNSERVLLENELKIFSIERDSHEKSIEIEFLKMKLNSNKNFFILIIISLIFIIILLIIFYLRTWKRNQQILFKFNMLEKESENKSKELINLYLALSKLKQFLSSLNDDINKLKNNANQDQLMNIDKLQNRIEYQKHFEEGWERLKIHFDTIHSGFFTRLKSKFPELTQSELRHCTYIKLQMFTSEIAQMLNIDNKSVQAGRYRIKKKMQLGPEVDLKTFLEDF